MLKELLDVIASLAGDGMIMICVSHEMGIAKTIAKRMIIMEDGSIVEGRNRSGVLWRHGLGTSRAIS